MALVYLEGRGTGRVGLVRKESDKMERKGKERRMMGKGKRREDEYGEKAKELKVKRLKEGKGRSSKSD